MNTSNTLCKKALLLAMIAATGIPASLASAQFQVEHSAIVEATTSNDLVNQESVVTILISDNDQSVHVKLINGEVSVVKVNDESVDKDHYFVRGNKLLIKNDDGEVIREVQLPKVQREDEVVHTARVWRAEPDDDSERVVERAYGFVTKDSVDDDGFFRQLQGQVYEPKVMLGINLGEPSKVLRKHLKLKDGVHAILVEDVIDGLPADKAGLEDFDVIISIDGSDDADGKLLSEVLSEKEPGDVMKIIVLRSGEKVKLKIKLAAYDAEALGSVPMSEINVDLDVVVDRDLDRGFPFLNRLNDGEFGNFEPLELERLKGELRKLIAQTESQRDMTQSMRAKAMDAMKDAERQIVEFRDGKLIVRSMEDLDRQFGRLNERLHDEVRDLHPEMIRDHMSELDERLSDLEDRIDHQMGRMSEQMDRLADMFERLMDRLEDDED